MALSDSDLMMLENLSYALSNSNPAYEFGLKALNACRTIGEYLSQFTDDILSELDKSKKTYDGENSGQEWAAMIRYMKKKKEIIELKIQEVTEKVVCFLNPNDNNNAIVAFRGTNGGEEWIDNVEGFNQSDTKYQLEAYEYIENLPYENITVVGHSKGGNKAQYVAIRCDKVERCISVDGQGFSQEFIDKYGPQIEANAHKVTCYSLSTDFVHILMYLLPGAKQVYINGGNDVENTGENHSPNAVFEYYVDSNGEWHIKVEGSGDAYLDITKEDSSMTMLHEFTVFVLYNMGDVEKEKTVKFLSGLLKGIFSDDWSSEQIINYAMQNRKDFTTVLAYLLKYIKLNNLDIDDAIKLIKALGLYDAIQPLLDSELLSVMGITIVSGKDVADEAWEFLLKNLTDGKNDKIIESILKKLGEKAGYDISGIWKETEEKYNDLKNTNNNKKDAQVTKIDHSNNAYLTMMNTIKSFENMGLPNVSSWNNYSGNGWFGKILASLIIRCINAYARKTQEINNNWRQKVNIRFSEISEIDLKYAKRLKKVNSQTKSLYVKIQSVF